MAVQPFKIGHETNSETFYPKFVQSPSGDFYIADVAGLHDNNGEMIELVNSMILKKLFTMSSRVRFLIPITYKSMEGSRGKAVKDHIQLLLRVFKGNIKDVVNSIQPVLTQVKPKESEFNLEDVHTSLNTQIHSMLQNYFSDQYSLNEEQLDIFIIDDKNTKENLNKKYKQFCQTRDQ